MTPSDLPGSLSTLCEALFIGTLEASAMLPFEAFGFLRLSGDDLQRALACHVEEAAGKRRDAERRVAGDHGNGNRCAASKNFNSTSRPSCLK